MEPLVQQAKNEEERLRVLRRYGVLDTPPDRALDELTALAAQICATPIALISIVDDHRQWFKAKVGLGFAETHRDLSFCSYALAHHDLCLVPDATLDPRFRNNPTVTGPEHIRFYAGAPLVTPDGHALGTLCVMDRAPRTLSPPQQVALRTLANQVMAQLELQRQRRELADSEARLRIVTENAHVGLIIVTADHVYAYANATYARLIGLPGTDVTGRRVEDVLPHEYDQIRPRLERAFAGERVDYELQRQQDGHERAFLARLEPVDNGAGERVVVVVITDVTDRRQTEAAMRLNHDRFQSIARATNDAVWDWDLRSNDVWWSDGYRPGAAAPAEDIEPRISVREAYIHPDDVARVMAGLHEVIASGRQAWADRYRFRRADGSYGLVADRGFVIRDAKGRALRMVGAMEDITERTRAEAAEKSTRDLLAAIIDSTPSAIFATDRQHRYTLVNAAYARFVGRPVDEIVGRTHHDFFPRDTADGFARVNDAIMAGGESVQFEEDVQGARLMTSKFALRGPGGAITGLAAVVTDVTDRHRANLALRETEERVRFALQSAKVGIWNLDVPTGALEWSETLEAQYGLAPGSFDGTIESYLAAVHPNDRKRTRAGVERLLDGNGGDFSFQHRSLWPDGTVRWLNGIGRLETDEQGRPRRGVGVSIDVTEQHLLEAQFQQAQKMEAVGRLAGGVAHDFNNLLTAILGYCELLQEDLPPGDSNLDSLMEIRRAGESAATLTRQLLAFSRNQLIEPARLDLNAVVAEMRAMLGRLIGEDVDVLLQLPPHVPLVLADRGQIEQVVMNLAVNARDAMPGGGTLRITTQVVELDAHTPVALAPGTYVMLTVADTGCGMSPDVQERLFEPFFTTKPVGKGTGLGLATVHGIVARSGGGITVESDVGLGSSFTIYLPAAAPDTAAQAAPPAPRHDQGTETVLVVEDAAALRDLTQRLLTRQGYQVLVAANAADAVATFDQHPGIDVLLTDVIMPGASGADLTRTLLARRPSLKVVFMSGYTDDAIAHHDVHRRGAAFLAKPFTSEALSRKLREVLDR